MVGAFLLLGISAQLLQRRAPIGAHGLICGAGVTPHRPQQGTGGNLRRDAWQRIQFRAEGQLPLLLVTIAFFVLFSLAAPRVFPTLLSLQSMAFQLPEVGLLALGVTLTMVAAGIDLSVVAIADLSGLSAAQFLHAAGSAGGGTDSWLLTGVALLVALAVGAACGAINGLLIGRVGITPILATLGTSGLFAGAAVVWTGGPPVVGLPASFLALGRTLPFGIPVPLLLFALGATGAAVVLHRTLLGLQIGLVGANASGRPLLRHSSDACDPLRATYMASGILAALAGIVIVARTSSASPAYGQSYILLAIVIAVLGGVDLPHGGFGTVAGVTLAAICLAIVQAGFSTLGVNQFLYQVAQGLILAGVIALRVADISVARRWVSGLLGRRPGGESDSKHTDLPRPEGNWRTVGSLDMLSVDPRWDELAEILVTHSTAVRPGDKS